MSDKRYLGNIITPTPTTPTANSGQNYGVANGVWSLQEVYRFVKAGTWPAAATAPGAPTIGTATAGNATATVAFTPNPNNGGLVPLYYTATSNPGSRTGTASSSPITVTGLTNGTSYTFTVTATNRAGTSTASGSSNSVTPQVPDTGIIAGGMIAAATSPFTVQSTARYVTIDTTGNSVTWGSLSSGATTYMASGGASTTRAVWGGGLVSGASINNIQYATFSSAGSLSDFGDLTVARYWASGGSNSTRALFYGGIAGPRLNNIDYVTIASAGNATDFGDTVQYGQEGGASYANPTYFFYAGGERDGYNNTSSRYRLTIATTGNTSSYGDLAASRDTCQGASNSTYGIVGGGTQSSGINVIDRHTMSTSSTSTDWGDMTITQSSYGAVSNSTRCVFFGGNEWIGAVSNPIQYVVFASSGNAIDFGEINGLSAVQSIIRCGGTSNAHGGL